MARLPKNKATLSRKKRDLATYRRFLPSLDLKRRQLLAERNKTRRHLEDLRRQVQARREGIAQDLPMLSNTGVNVDRLVTVRGVETGEANVVGVRVPTLSEVHMERRSYGYLTKPHWVDGVAARLEAALRQEITIQITEERLRRLEAGLVKVTQRVNLFDKVLIPRTEDEIQRIDIALQDAERASVIRAKIAKRRRAGARTDEAATGTGSGTGAA